MNGREIRQVLLSVIDSYSRRPATSFQSRSILEEAATQLKIHRNVEAEQVLLTYWHDLLRTGHIAWGYDVGNPDPPFCHLTEQGRKVLAHLSRDPMNPDGYLSYLNSEAPLDTTTLSYISEALQTYVANCYKATAVMVGCAAESLALRLRDTLVSRMRKVGQTPSSRLTGWKLKQILEEIERVIRQIKSVMPNDLLESFESHWPSFMGQIRMARNDAGHPKSVLPITPETVYASLLIFPELARLSRNLEQWVENSYA